MFVQDLSDYEADASNSGSRQSTHRGKRVTRSDDDDDDYLCNTMLLLGPAGGIGKTAMVYALAHELGFKARAVPSLQGPVTKYCPINSVLLMLL